MLAPLPGRPPSTELLRHLLQLTLSQFFVNCPLSLIEITLFAQSQIMSPHQGLLKSALPVDRYGVHRRGNFQVTLERAKRLDAIKSYMHDGHTRTCVA